MSDQTLTASHLSIEDGLPDDGAWELEFDSKGLLWIGTQMGLAYSDGASIWPVPFHSSAFPDFTVPRVINIRAMAIDAADNIWVGEESGFIFCYVRETEQFELVFPDPTRGFNEVFPSRPTSLFLSSEGNLWLNTFDRQVYHLQIDMVQGRRRRFVVDSIQQVTQNGPINTVNAVTQDEKGTIWIGTSKGLGTLAETPPAIEIHPLEATVSGKNTPNILFLTSGQNNSIWAISDRQELIQYQHERQKTDRWELPFENIRDQSAQGIFEDPSGQVWIRYDLDGLDKLARFNPRTGQFTNIEFTNYQNTWRLTGYDVMDSAKNKNGSLFFAIHRGGIIKYTPQNAFFTFYPLSVNNSQKESVDYAFQIQVDGNNVPWVNFQSSGLFVLDLETRQYLPWSDLLPYPSIMDSSFKPKGCQRDHFGNIWIWDDNRVIVYDFQEKSFRNISQTHPFINELEGLAFRGFITDQKKNLWILRDPNLYKCNLEADSVSFSINFLERVKEGNDHYNVADLFLDTEGIFWLGTNSFGFFRYNPSLDSINHFSFSPGKSFTEHRNDRMYVSTYKDGIIDVDRNSLETKSITTNDGLPYDKIRGGMGVDHSGNLWVGSLGGLTKINPETRDSRTFDVADGLPSNHFSTSTTGQLFDGQLLFGTENGVVQIDPSRVLVDSTPPDIQLLTFSLFNQQVQPSAGGPLDRSIQISDKLTLHHRQNDFTISFAALHFKNPGQNTYAARLHPYQQEFRELGTTNKVSYNNLDPGRYTLQVKAANSDGVWNEEGISLDIVILPPWFWNTWSKLLYFLLIAGVIYGLYRFQLNRRLALAEASRLRELDEVKTNLYTNITHEFRTPLTVIKGITQQIQGHDTEKKLIERNSDQVLDLVQQMLDLAKVDAGQASVSMVHGDILYFLRYVVESFHSLAFQQKITLHFYAEEEAIKMDYDPEKIMGILSNIISNAIKFTPEYGKIQVVARQISDHAGEENALELLIKDTGVGIDQAHLPFLFDRFYQVDASRTRRGEGTGIGLSLTKEWVELMDGQITVESEVDRGTTFLVRLPITHNARAADSALIVPLRPERGMQAGRIAAQRPTNWLGTIANRPLLLIVEDNLDVQHYLTRCLESEYRLVFARNGREGLDRAHQYIPDLIISDVMMPEMDGFELCHQLKTDHRTSHIPIIMLTARASAQDRITGLQKGADAYLAKPFSHEELHVRLEKLIELRHRLREKYGQGFPMPDPDSISEDTELAFLHKLHQAVHDNMEREDFKLDQLARELTMSRMQLHRKLKALTDQTPAQYVKQIRMAYAKKLLLETTLTVSEVATRVGFRSHAHFSTAFKEFFGIAPSEV